MTASYTVQIGAPDQSLEEIVDFLARIFGPNYYEAEKIQNVVMRSEASTSPGNFVTARSDRGDLIGVVRIVERQMMLGQAVLNCGGISSVSVHPDWRRQGLNQAMMDLAIREMERRGMDLSYLYGRRAMDGYYTKFGYIGVNRYLRLKIISSVSGEPALQLSPFAQQHLDCIRAGYDQTYCHLGGSIIRDEKVWRFLIARMKATPAGFQLLACHSMVAGECIGYVVVSGDQLIEAAIPDTHFVHLPQVLAQVGIGCVSVHPRHPYYRFVRTNFNTIAQERLNLDGGYMARIINPLSFISKLAGDLCRRAREIGLAGEKIRLAGWEIDLDSGCVLKASQLDDVIFERQERLLHLLIGMHEPNDDPGYSLNPEKPWLTYLFPASGFHTSAFDEI